MSGTEIMDSVLKTAEKVASVDLEQAGQKAVETVKNLNAETIAKCPGKRCKKATFSAYF